MRGKDEPAKEGRRGARFRHDSVLEISDDSGRLVAEVSRLIDVSSVGVSFTTTHVFAKGERIRAKLRFLGAGALQIAGRVVRIKAKNNSTVYAVELDSARSKRS